RGFRVLAWQGATVSPQCAHRLPIPASTGPSDRIFDLFVCRVRPPEAAPAIDRQQLLFDELVQPVKVDIRQNRAGHPALRRAAERGVPAPVLAVGCIYSSTTTGREILVSKLTAALMAPTSPSLPLTIG